MDPQGILKAFPKRKKIRADPSSKALAKVPRKEAGDAGGELARPRTHALEPSAICFHPESEAEVASHVL